MEPRKKRPSRPRRYQSSVPSRVDFTDDSREYEWDWDGPCRDSPPDVDDSSRDEWLWSNGVAIFHSLQDLPPSIQRELDRHEWLFLPKHGDRHHAFAVQNELSAEKFAADSATRIRQSERRGSMASGAKMTEVDVAAIAGRRAKGETIQSIADDLGVSRTAVWNAANGRSWRHVKKSAPAEASP